MNSNIGLNMQLVLEPVYAIKKHSTTAIAYLHDDSVFFGSMMLMGVQYLSFSPSS